MLAWTMGLVMALVFISGISGMTSEPAPAAPRHVMSEENTEKLEWIKYEAEAYADYSDEFTRIYNGYQVRWSKNGRLMLRDGDSGPYKFVKRSI